MPVWLAPAWLGKTSGMPVRQCGRDPHGHDCLGSGPALTGPARWGQAHTGAMGQGGWIDEFRAQLPLSPSARMEGMIAAMHAPVHTMQQSNHVDAQPHGSTNNQANNQAAG